MAFFENRDHAALPLTHPTQASTCTAMASTGIYSLDILTFYHLLLLCPSVFENLNF